MKRLTGRLPSPALVVACLALGVALSGVAYAAALPRNSVGTLQLKTNAVTSTKVLNGSLKPADLAPGLIPPSGAIIRTRTGGVNFDGSLTTIMTAPDIPAGSYVAVYRGDVVNFGVSSTSFAYMRCQIESPPGTAIAGATTFAHDDNAGNGEVIVNQMTVADVITLASPGTVRVRCSADNGAGPYVENNRLLLIRVKDVDAAAVTS